MKMNITEEDLEYNAMIRYIENNSTHIRTDHGTLYEYQSEEIFSTIYRMFDESGYNYQNDLSKISATG